MRLWSQPDGEKRMTLNDLYSLAESHDIELDEYKLRNQPSLCIQCDDGSCAVAIDPERNKTTAQRKTVLGHELGHCETGSFYNRYAALDVIQKHENRANRWSIEHQIPEEEYWAAVKAGYTEPWQIAERFDVLESLARMAMCWYAHGTLDTSQYFDESGERKKTVERFFADGTPIIISASGNATEQDITRTIGIIELMRSEKT